MLQTCPNIGEIDGVVHLSSQDTEFVAGRVFTESYPYQGIYDTDMSRYRARVAEENPEWTQERLDVAEQGYRDYLVLTQTNPGRHSPGRDIDQFWHAHILHTEEYALFCKRHLNRFLHHIPFTVEEKAKIDGDAKCSGGCVGKNCRCGPFNVEQYKELVG